MGIVVRFPRRHGRASLTSKRRAAIRAKVSSEISSRPEISAKPTTPTQCELGMPRTLQPLTVETDCFSAVATFSVPPSASMIEPAESMGIDIVRVLRTSQEFANRETTIRMFHGGVLPMDNAQKTGRRLVALRQHLKLNQSDFAEQIGVGKNTLNPFETGKRPLSFETAKKIHQRYEISLDWLLYGKIGQPNQELAMRLGPNPEPAIETKPPKAVKTTKTKGSSRLKVS